MHLQILRQEYSDKQTLGYLYVVDNEEILFSCNTLELPWKDNQQNVSCVPIGEYKCALEYSDRFQRDLWELKDVPNRSECKFHSANYFRQLNGCIALGDSFKDIDGDGYKDVTNSVETMRKFHNVLNFLTEIQLIIK